MKLISLELNNFRQFQSAKIDFPTGIVAITGDNGAGKTTIIESVLFCLFGSKAVRGKTDELRTKGATVPLLVTLKFSLNEIIYRVERSTTDASLFVAGESEPIAKGTVGVTDRLQKILRLTREEFTSTFFTEQKGLEFLSGKKGAAERERFIIRMMGYDTLESVQELLRDERKTLKAQVLGFQSGLQDREKLASEVNSAELEIKEASEKLKDKILSLEALSKDNEVIRNEFKVAEDNYLKWQNASKLVLQSETIYNQKTKLLSETNSKINESKELLKKEDILKNIVDFTLINGIIENKRSEFTTLKSKQTELNNSNLSIQNELSLCDEKQNSDTNRIEDEINRCKLEIQKFENLISQGICPSCGQITSNISKKLISESQDKINILSKRLEDVKESYNHQKSALKSKIIELQSFIKNVDKEVISLEETLKNLEKQLSIVLSLSNLEEQVVNLRVEIAQADETLRQARAEQSKIKFNEENYISLKAKLTASDSMLSVARLQKVELEGQLKTKIALVEKTKSLITEIDNKLASIDQMNFDLSILEESDEVITFFRKHLNETIRPTLSSLASDFLSDLTDGRYSEVFIGSDFAPTVFDEGQVKSVISGGETDILNLCLRLALSQYLAERAGQPLTLLVLDEVFGSLDSQRRYNVLQLLEKLKNRFEQIIIISHMEDTKDSVEHLIEVKYDSTIGISEIQALNNSSYELPY
jgi:DNA repair exonuclease SbcCD ATPase subunit